MAASVQNPALANTVDTDWVTMPDGTSLYTKTWIAHEDKPKATLVLVHGMGEHIARYDHLCQAFARAGISVYGFDQRGFGRTGRRQDKGAVLGHGEGLDTTLADIDEMLRRTKMADVPQFLMGHSMGGNLVLNYIVRGKSRNTLTGAIATAPFIRVPAQPAMILQKTVRGISKMLPTFTIHTKIDVNELSRNAESNRLYQADWLVHDLVSLQTIGELFEAGQALLDRRYEEIHTPLFLAHGTKDKVTDYNATKSFHEKLQGITEASFKSYDGCFHELHNEPEQEKCIQDYIDWILSKLATASK